PSIQFFLRFHRERITEAHYFRWYDYPKLCTELVFLLAEHSDALRHAMIAFSALIYSFKLNHDARPVACWYYERAVHDLRVSLNISPMSMTECLTAVSTALQLSSFEVCYIFISGLTALEIFGRLRQVFSTSPRSCKYHTKK